MKRWLTTLILVWAAMVHAQSVTLAWTASASPDVSNYRVYYGTSSRNYTIVTNCGLVLTQTVVLPHTGRWFFAATALDTNDLESVYSNEAEWEAKPAPPLLHGETWVRLTPVIECSTNLSSWVCTSLLARSAPMCAYIPKYHWLPFLVWCISGSRCLA